MKCRIIFLVHFSCLISFGHAQSGVELKTKGDLKASRLQSQGKSFREPVLKEEDQRDARERQTANLANAKQIALSAKLDSKLAKGWELIKSGRYRESLEAFTLLMKVRKGLERDLRSDVFLGWGISLFHQKGCALAQKPLRLALESSRSREDALYYLALCDVEGGQYNLARERFKVLLDAQHPQYEEPSRFYLAVIDEEEFRYEEAKSSFQDIADFSNDKKLVEMAKIKAAAIDFKISKDRRSRKRFTAAASLGFGHDTNATQLPQGLDPSSQSLDAESSLTSLGMFFAEYRIPFAHNFDQSFSYNLLLLHYLSHKIALNSDLHSQEISTKLSWDNSLFSSWVLGLKYNYVFLGEIKELDAYMATLGADLIWSKALQGKSGAVTSQLNSNFGFSKQESIKGFTSSQDPEAFNYLLDVDWTYLGIAQHTFGPGVSVEYHPADGFENSYFKVATGFEWGWTLPAALWNLRWTNGVDVANSRYYDASTGRVDWLASASSSLSRMWGSSLESRLQLTGMKNFSNVPRSFQYNKFQTMFVMTAFF